MSSVPRPVLWVIGLCFSLVAAVAAVVSFLDLTRVAEHVRIPRPLSAALPISVDAGGALATVLWILSSGKVRVWAMTVALGALVVSVLGNAIGALLLVGEAADEATKALAVSIALIFPVMLSSSVHLLIMWWQPSPAAETKPEKAKQARKTRPQPVKAERLPRPEPTAPEIPAADEAKALTPAQPEPEPVLSDSGTVPQFVPGSKMEQAYHHFLALNGQVTAAQLNEHIGSTNYVKRPHLLKWAQTLETTGVPQ